METDRRLSNLELFASYAQNDFGKWKKLKGLRVKHKTLGSGIITGIDRALNNQIDVRIQFGGDGHWIRLDPLKNEFIAKFTDLAFPNLLKMEILKGWEEADQKWERAKKNREERQQREQEKRRKQELEKQRKLESRRQAERELKRQQELELSVARRRKAELLKKAEQEKRHRRCPLEPFIQSAKQVLNAQIKATVDIPNLNAQDIQLALKWYPGILQQFSVRGFNKDVLIENDDCELKRVLSARAAEKSVMEFYQRYGHHVEDVSIHQFTSESPDWKEYDLKINGLSLDVKNSRRSKQSPDSYVEHCVPSFKRDRGNQEVTILRFLKT